MSHSLLHIVINKILVITPRTTPDVIVMSCTSNIMTLYHPYLQSSPFPTCRQYTSLHVELDPLTTALTLHQHHNTYPLFIAYYPNDYHHTYPILAW